MTNPEWKEYTGSDDQIIELQNAEHGFIIKNIHGHIWKKIYFFWHQCPAGSSHYLICKPHPLADMICQQARTGQPVYIKTTIHLEYYGDCCSYSDPTTTPDWNLKAEYSFTEFKEEV